MDLMQYIKSPKRDERESKSEKSAEKRNPKLEKNEKSGRSANPFKKRGK